MRSHFMQHFARVSFFGRFLASKRHTAESHFRIRPLLERCAGLRSEKRSLRPALMVALTRYRHGVRLVVTHPPFPPYSHNWHTGNSTARYLLWSPGARRAWSVRAQAASWSRNTQTVSTASMCRIRAEFYALWFV